MKTSSLELLESSELPAAQARAILKVLEAEMDSAHETLATKADLNAMEGKLSRMLLQCFFGGVGLLAGAVYFLYVHPGR